MKERNRRRLALIDVRFGHTNDTFAHGEAFDDAFWRAANDVIRRVMNDVIAELEKLDATEHLFLRVPIPDISAGLDCR